MARREPLRLVVVPVAWVGGRLIDRLLLAVGLLVLRRGRVLGDRLRRLLGVGVWIGSGLLLFEKGFESSHDWTLQFFLVAVEQRAG